MIRFIQTSLIIVKSFIRVIIFFLFLNISNLLDDKFASISKDFFTITNYIVNHLLMLYFPPILIICSIGLRENLIQKERKDPSK